MNKVVVGGIIVVVIIAVAIFFFYSPSQPIEEPREEGVMTGLEIARLTSDYIDTQKTAEGIYSYSSHCEPNCPQGFSGSFHTTNAWTSLANTGLYSATGDKNYLNNAKKDADVLIEWCADKTSECLWVLVQINELYKTTNDAKYLDFLTNAGDVLLETPAFEHGMISGIEARELALLYELTGDTKYLDESLVRLDKSKSLADSSQILYAFGGFEVHDTVCWNVLAEAELYAVTQDDKYLENVNLFFTKSNVKKYTNQLIFLSNIQPCIESLLALYAATGDVKYKEDAIAMAEYVITNTWDSAESKKAFGEGAFLMESGSTLNSLTDSGYMVFLLSKLKSEKFRILK
mgnify:CR=1 FL=1|jgi:rhamnogalacturonyl hydrolase YesR|tara:strand:+ start:89 stop:1126 length:1038 start_codon:yes stop_codon:yes gene_type:complete